MPWNRLLLPYTNLPSNVHWLNNKHTFNPTAHSLSMAHRHHGKKAWPIAYTHSHITQTQRHTYFPQGKKAHLRFTGLPYHNDYSWDIKNPNIVDCLHITQALPLAHRVSLEHTDSPCKTQILPRAHIFSRQKHSLYRIHTHLIAHKYSTWHTNCHQRTRTLPMTHKLPTAQRFCSQHTDTPHSTLDTSHITMLPTAHILPMFPWLNP